MRDDARDEMRRQVQQSLIAAKRKQLDDEFGLVASGDSGPLPPEVELAWLEHIQEFERQFADAKLTTIRRRLGEPDPPPLAALGAGEVADALDALLERLAACNIAVDFLGDWDEWSAYRHLVEEMLDYEIEDIRIDGLVTGFTPTTPAFEAAMAVDFYVQALFARNRDYLMSSHRRKDDADAQVDRPDVAEDEALLDRLWSVLAVSQPARIDMHDIDIGDDVARASGEISWVEKGQEHVVVASFELRPSPYSEWEVVDTTLPATMLAESGL